MDESKPLPFKGAAPRYTATARREVLRPGVPDMSAPKPYTPDQQALMNGAEVLILAAVNLKEAGSPALAALKYEDAERLYKMVPDRKSAYICCQSAIYARHLAWKLEESLAQWRASAERDLAFLLEVKAQVDAGTLRAQEDLDATIASVSAMLEARTYADLKRVTWDLAKLANPALASQPIPECLT